MEYVDFKPVKQEVLVSFSFEELEKLYELTGNFQFKVISEEALADKSYLEDNDERLN